MGQEQERDEFNLVRDEVNTEAERKVVDYYIRKFEDGISENGALEQEWNDMEQVYESQRLAADTSTKKGAPNTVVNIFLPNIEGQVASMTQNEVTAQFKGRGYADHKFARTANVVIDPVFDAVDITGLTKDFGRDYIMKGNAVFVIDWDPEAWDDFGLPEVRVENPLRIVVDSRIKNMKYHQKAEYVAIEMGHVSVNTIKHKYGEKKAHAVTLGNNRPGFHASQLHDDEDSTTLIKVWHRDNPKRNLQRLIMSACGVHLEESSPDESYYKYVYNQYPIAWERLYPRNGEFLGHGDGKLLMPIQKLMNELFDEVVKACKFSSQRRTFIDPKAKIKPSDYNNDPDDPIAASNPRQNIYDQQGGGLNPVVFNLLSMLFQKVQEMTRFSNLMTGNSPESNITATQAGIQMNQGNTGIDEKRRDVSHALSFVAWYCVMLCAQFWPGAKIVRVAEDPEAWDWIDARELLNVPVMMEASTDFRDRFKGKNPHDESPKFMQLEVTEEHDSEEPELDESGQILYDDKEGGEKTQRMKKVKKKVPATKCIEMDAEVSIGEGLPTNKVALYNIVLSLAQLQLIDETTGQPRPLLSFRQVREMIEDTVGLKIPDDQKQQQGMLQKMQQQMPQGMPGQQGPININPNIPGANQNGAMGGGGAGAI